MQGGRAASKGRAGGRADLHPVGRDVCDDVGLVGVCRILVRQPCPPHKATPLKTRSNARMWLI